MIHPWKLPASALLDPRWNAALDLVSSSSLMSVSPAGLATAWEELGPEEVLATLRALAGTGGEDEAPEGTEAA